MVEGFGVYVIRTLRDFFHMGSVECVTFQEPDSHDNGGGAIAGDGVLEGSDDGARSVTMMMGGLAGVGVEMRV
jgi:hypothetical protein